MSGRRVLGDAREIEAPTSQVAANGAPRFAPQGPFPVTIAFGPEHEVGLFATS